MELYDVGEVTFTLTGPEATILYDIISGELRKSNSTGRTAIERVREKLNLGAMAAIKLARDNDPKVGGPR